LRSVASVTVARRISFIAAIACLASLAAAVAAEPKADASIKTKTVDASVYVALVPWEALKPYLTPEGTKIFGGARPQGDDGER
jgi:hypothetical protein